MEHKEIIEESIKSHQNAVDKAKKELAGLEVTYSIGDRFMRKNSPDKYILTQPDAKKICLIGLMDGNRWRDPISSEHVYRITAQELKNMAGYDTFTRYWDSQKKINTK